jgi:hypothetical protein
MSNINFRETGFEVRESYSRHGHLCGSTVFLFVRYHAEVTYCILLHEI